VSKWLFVVVVIVFVVVVVGSNLVDFFCFAFVLFYF
jgi:hypothetical protein